MTIGESNIGEREKNLINASIDGELSATQFAELDDILEHSPEARQYHSDLQRVDSILKEMPEQELPPGLHDTIVTVCDGKLQGKPKTDSGRKSPVLFGVAASIIVLIMIGIYQDQANLGSTDDTDAMAGTIAPQASNDDKIGTQTVNLAIESTGLTSLSTLQRTDDANILSVSWQSDDEIVVRIDLSTSGLTIDSLDDKQNELESVSVDGPIVQLRGRGRQRFEASFGRSDTVIDQDAIIQNANINIEFSRDGALIQRGVLALD